MGNILDKIKTTFKETLNEKNLNLKAMAFELGLTEAEFSKKFKKPHQSFSESEFRVIKWIAKTDYAKLKGLEDEHAIAIFAPDRILVSISQRLTKLESINLEQTKKLTKIMEYIDSQKEESEHRKRQRVHNIREIFKPVTNGLR